MHNPFCSAMHTSSWDTMTTTKMVKSVKFDCCMGANSKIGFRLITERTVSWRGTQINK